MGLDLADVDPHRRADVAMDHVMAVHHAQDRMNRPPRALSAREALFALHFEVSLVGVIAANLRRGVTLTEGDWQRLTTAINRIDFLASEAIA